MNTKPEKVTLQDVIDEQLSAMAGFDAHSDEYAAAAKALKTLYEAQALEPKANRISAETWATIGANLAGIIMILTFEKTNVLTSKALSYVKRLN